jgi:hypothetical protein
MGPHACQGLSRAGWNDPSAGSVVPSAILGGAAKGDTSGLTDQKKINQGQRNEEGNSFITPASSLHIQHVEEHGHDTLITKG